MKPIVDRAVQLTTIFGCGLAMAAAWHGAFAEENSGSAEATAERTAKIVPLDGPRQPIQSLDPPKMFESIEDEAERSIALYLEAGKVIVHPRCINCHPAGDVPLQGELGALHEPPVVRGPENKGALGMHCATCHPSENFDPGRVPGHPLWHLAPIEMAWEGKTLGEICRQIKDPERNGGKSMEELVHHMEEDSLVGWAWDPGVGREPAPGTQEQFGKLIRAWADSGAVCPGD